jgi:acyl-CoA synthetase (AMP-forming)/AMP-acid ligase II
VFGNMMDQPLLISQQIEFAARFHSNVEVVTRTVEGPIVRTTWGEIGRRARQLASALEKLGVKRGDRVATIAWNTQRHLELYFAVSGMGAVLHTINPRLSPEQLHYVVDHAEDHVLFFDTTFGRLADLVKSKIAHVYALDHAYEQLLATGNTDYAWPELDERAASSLCYTSGTSGHPKGVLYSHRSTVLHSFAICMADALALSGADVVLPVVPMFHVNAWGVPYAAAMVGAKLVLPGPGLDGKNLTELIVNEGVSNLLGVPTVWSNLLGHLSATNTTLTTVKKVVIGGSACPPSMIQAFEQRHNARVIHAWGMTETSPLGTANILLPKHDALADDEKLSIKLKQGRPIYGVQMRIVDVEGKALPHDGTSSGDLQVRGPWVASGYFKQDTLASFHDGWFITGDIATIDGDAFMQITDRSKDVIKSGGEWISSIEIENAALSHPQVAQAACIAAASTKWGERPLLVVVRAAGSDVTAASIHAFLETKLLKWWLPDAVEFVDALPIGPTGKVLKRTLRDHFKDHVLR